MTRFAGIRTLLLLPLILAFGCHDLSFKPRDYGDQIAIFDDLFSVSVPSSDHAVATGYWGAIYVTNDGGASWTKADSGTDALLYDVSMATPEKGWAVGQLGLVLRTEDGGASWTEQPNNKRGEVHLFSVQAIDENRAWAVGEWGTRIYTENGGKTWVDHSLTIDDAHPQFVWLSPSDQEKVRAGESVFEDVSLTDLYCLPRTPESCWLIGEFGYIFYTRTGGIDASGVVDWTPGAIVTDYQIEPIVVGHNSIQITDEHRASVKLFADSIVEHEHLNVAIEPRVTEAEIAAFGGDADPIPLFEIIEARTQEIQAALEDSGILLDRIRRRGAPPWDYEDFLESDPEFLDRWRDTRRASYAGVEIQISQNPYLFSVRFGNDEDGLISGLGGIILKSQDGGETWRYESVGRKQALFAVQPLPDRSIVVGEKGFMRISQDGGATWKQPAGFPTLFTFMRDVAFDSRGLRGFIVGQRGSVLRSEDGGATWERVLPPPDRVRGV